MFSVIIPLYNKAPYIVKAVRSVLEQSWSDFELIIVNDGSTDDSLVRLQEMSELYKPGLWEFYLNEDEESILQHNSRTSIRVYCQANQGVSFTRNKAVNLARYELLAFLDADDWWDSQFLCEMARLIQSYPQAALYSSGYFKVINGRYVVANIGVDKGFSEGEYAYFDVYANTMYQPVWTGATILKKSIFHEFGGFNPVLKMGEDFDLWHRVASRYPVVLLNQPLAYYNQDVDQANRAIGLKLYAAHEHMLFSDYSHMIGNASFWRLYEVLAVYGLLPYYLTGRNRAEVDRILNTIHWKNHSFRYRLYYRILPRWIVRGWLKTINVAYHVKVSVKAALR